MFKSENENDYSEDIDFLHAKNTIGLYPVDTEMISDEDREILFKQDCNFPSFTACGLQWFPIIEDAITMEFISDYRLSDWGVEDYEVFNSALENVDRKMSEATITACDSIDQFNFVPFLRIGFDSENGMPGSALILSQRVISTLHRHLGDFYAFPYERSAFYAISKNRIDRDSLSPYLTFRHIASSVDSVSRVPELSEKILLCGTDGMQVITPRVVMKKPSIFDGDGWEPC